MRRAVGLPDHDGLLVEALDEGGPADRAGVKRGDLLVSIGGATLATIDDLHAALAANAGLCNTELRVLRATERVQLSVDLQGAER
jgi:serine protease Do